MYLPEFKGPIEGWTVNMLTKQVWRVSRTHSFEEVMQEAYIVFMRCAARYPIVDTPQHFMSLYKRAWTNELNDLSIKASRAAMLVSENHADPEADEAWSSDAIGEHENLGQLSTMIRQAPREVLMVINLFLNAPTELLELASQAWSKQGKRKPEGNAMLARLLGTDPNQDLIDAVERYFTQ